jgi:arylsulfatase A
MRIHRCHTTRQDQLECALNNFADQTRERGKISVSTPSDDASGRFSRERIMMRTIRFGVSALAALIAAGAPLYAADRLPNIVIIFTDDQGYADVGCFGARGFATPNLDRLAREGRRFTNFHVAQPVCSASRAALLTGCYPNRIGIHGALGPKSKGGIADGETTIAEILKARGYATGIAGKWHLGHHPRFLPIHHGFDEYLGLPYSNDMWPDHPEAIRGTYPTLPLIDGDQVVDANVTSEDQCRLTGLYTERALSFINRHKDRPFFFYLAHSMPHVPLHVSALYRGKSAQGLYGDVIQEIDASVGAVLKALQSHGLEKNTLVIFATDNGPWLSYGNHAGSAGALREGKGTCWEGGVRVPCIMRWPGQIPAGTTSDAMLMTIDLLPTIAGLVGAPLPRHPIDGLDVWPLLAGKPGATNPHDAYVYYYEKNELQAVVSGDGRWKLQLPHTYRSLAGKPGGHGGSPSKYQQIKIKQPELYDLTSELGETTDLASRHPDVVKRLLAVAERARVELGDSLTKRQGRGVRPAGQFADANAQR